MKYTDARILDLTGSDWAQVVEAEATARKNLAGDRAIVKWDGDDPDFVLDLGLTVRTAEEAREYYNDPANGWTEEIE